MSLAAARPVRAAARATWADRLLAVAPLLAVFLWLSVLYVWEAWALRTPWVFSDELEFTQLARSLAEAGETARRGQPHPFGSLAVFFTAPAWLLDDARAAYDTAKYIGALAMTASVFPAYFLARMLVSPRAALFAAAGTGAIPAFMYSSLLLSEPFAYTWSTLCLFLLVKALATRRPAWIGAASAASVIAPLVRNQLAVLPVVLATASLVAAWTSERARTWRGRWTRWDYVGAAMLAAGVLIVLNELVSNRSESWDVATRLYKGRMLEYGIWAGGALAVGLGVLPVVAGLATVVRRPGERRTRELDAFRLVFVTAVVGFAFYTAVKAAFLSTVFATRVLERNLIYLAPLFFVATALWLERPRLRPLGIALGTAVAAVLIGRGALQLEYPYFEAPGFGLLAWANREYEWSQGALEGLLWVVLAVAVLLVLAPVALRGRRQVNGAALALAAALVLAWNVAGQLSASGGSRSVADLFLSNLPKPVDWVDEATGGERAFYLGKDVRDPTGVNLLEFWNRSLAEVWSLDGTAPGPGPTRTPDLAETNGLLRPDAGYPYVVADNGIDVVGRPVAQRGGLRLVRVEPPLRLRSSVTGIYSDGWSRDVSAYSQFSTATGRGGTMLVSVSRVNSPGNEPPGRVLIRVGPLVVGGDRQPAIVQATAEKRWTVRPHEQQTFRLPTPRPPFRVEVFVDTFVPAELDARSGDVRPLGAQVEYRFVAAPS